MDDSETNLPPETLHVKPTSEELKANIERAAAEIDGIAADEKKTVEDAVKRVDAPEIPKEEVKDEIDEVIEEESKEDGELKKKLSASAREAQVLAAKNKQFSEAVEASETLAAPTEEDLKVEAVKLGFDFELMSDVEKALFGSSILNKRKLERISEVARAGKDVEEWNGKVDEFVGNPQSMLDNPRLEGKEEDFKLFASKNTRRGLPFDDLVSAFLYNYDQNKPKHKGAMFERGTGGPSDKEVIKSDKLSAGEADLLRLQDYNKFVEYLKAGKIDSAGEV